MKQILCVLALALGVAGCSAIDVKGIVRDDKTGEPLPGAAVQIGDETTRTDLTGYYELEVSENDGDPQAVHVTKAGYSGFSEQVAFDEDADEVFQDIELKKVQHEDEVKPGQTNAGDTNIEIEGDE
jgi:uncharacterized membrane protein